jgi:hypothetical protein
MYTAMIRLFFLCTVLMLSACVTPQVAQPERLGLKLAPAELGAEIALQQHLKIARHGRIDELDAALEVDAQHLELVGLAFGQRVLSLHYDGKELKSWRHAMLPAQVRAEDVLEDLQLTLWPIEAISKALPTGWRIQDAGLRRTLYKEDSVVTVIDYSEMPRWHAQVELENLRFEYHLTIKSAPNDPDEKSGK